MRNTAATTRGPAAVLEAGEPFVREATMRARLGRQLIAFGQWIAGQPDAGSGAAQADAPSSAAATTGNDRFASLASMIPGVVYQCVVTPEGDIR